MYTYIFTQKKTKNKKNQIYYKRSRDETKQKIIVI